MEFLVPPPVAAPYGSAAAPEADRAPIPPFRARARDDRPKLGIDLLPAAENPPLTETVFSPSGGGGSLLRFKLSIKLTDSRCILLTDDVSLTDRGRTEEVPDG